MDHFEYKLEHLLKWETAIHAKFHRIKVTFLDYHLVEKPWQHQYKKNRKGITKHIAGSYERLFARNDSSTQRQSRL